MKKAVSLIAIIMVFVFSVNICLADTPVTTPAPTTQEAKHPMKDLDINSELGKSVLKLYEAGVVNGYKEADGSFTYRADKTITRAEFAKMINTTFGYTLMADNKFKDVNPQKWYYVDVLVAIYYAYIQGYEDGTFRGDGNITREQACVILDRIVGKKAETKPVITDEVSAWAKDSVENIIGLGYMPLEEGGKFRAKEFLTRGELALTLDDFAVVKKAENTQQNQQTQQGQQSQNTGSTSTGSSSTSSGGIKDSNEGADIGGSNSGNTSGGNTSGGNTSGGNTSGGNDPGSGDSGDISVPETTYNITYNLDDGNLSGGAKKTYKSSDADYTLLTPWKTNYKFLGWFESEDADPLTTEPVTVIPNGSSGDKEYFAKWGEYYTIKYELYFKPYGEEMDDSAKGRLDGSEKKKYTAYDEEYVLPIPERDDGIPFIGWYELQEFENGKLAVFFSDEYLVETIPVGTEGNKHYQAVWDDALVESEEIYIELNNAIIGLEEALEFAGLDMPGDSLTVLTMALETMRNVVTWEDMGVIIHNRLVREVYTDEGNIMRDIIRAVNAAGEYDKFYNEITTKIPSYTLLTIQDIFNIHDAFLDQ